MTFWDLFGEQGHPIRATVSEMGPLLLARLLELNDVQEGVLNIAFRVADDANLPVLDLKDLRALLNFVVENADTVSAKYGNVAKASVASVQRQLLVLENQGADKFFGEPALEPAGLHEDRPRRPRHRQHPGRRQADDEAAALRVLPAVDAVGAVRAAARGRRSRQAEARLLLRRGASSVQRRAQAALWTQSSRSSG